MLSYGERIVTYVNKLGGRSEHPLDDILPTGRTDISKRLKYTKDIMYRLIHCQHPMNNNNNNNNNNHGDEVIGGSAGVFGEGF